jgi:hypothetical protein
VIDAGEQGGAGARGLRAVLETVPGATVQRNSVLPEKIPAGGLIILRDGDPGERSRRSAGSGARTTSMQSRSRCMLRKGNAAARDAAFDALLQQIGGALEADPTLGGFAFGLTYGRPEASIEAVAGAPAIKSATLTATVEYETEAPLA